MSPCATPIESASAAWLRPASVRSGLICLPSMVKSIPRVTSQGADQSSRAVPEGLEEIVAAEWCHTLGAGRGLEPVNDPRPQGIDGLGTPRTSLT